MFDKRMASYPGILGAGSSDRNSNKCVELINLNTANEILSHFVAGDFFLKYILRRIILLFTAKLRRIV